MPDPEIKTWRQRSVTRSAYAGEWESALERYSWSVVALRSNKPLVAVEFQGRGLRPGERDEDTAYLCGLENHWPQSRPKPYEGAVAHDYCPVLGEPCWHDGSNLQGMEVYRRWDEAVIWDALEEALAAALDDLRGKKETDA